ncbi:MAG: hypothetical protein ABIH41_06970 [Nanoarchaeota archaeon]
MAVVIALFSGSSPPSWASWVLAGLGIIVGLLNVTDKETTTFLVASIAFLVSFGSLSSVLSGVLFGWTAIGAFFDLMVIFVAPGAAIVAVKAIFSIAKN